LAGQLFTIQMQDNKAPVKEKDRYRVDINYILNHPKFEAVQHSLNMSGGYRYVDPTGEDAPTHCYNPYLILLFRQRDLPVFDVAERRETIIDAGIFFDAYEQGYRRGIIHFQEKYTVTPTVLYSSQTYVESIKRLYYGDGSQWPEPHCLQENRWCKMSLSDTIFEKAGFWAGLTFCIKELFELHPDVFFYKAVGQTKSQPKPRRASTTQSGFESFLKTEYQYLLLFLIDNFTGKEPQQYAYLLFALKEEGITIAALFRNRSELHRAMTKTFGNVGSSENLRQQLSALDETQSRNEASNNRINQLRIQIREQLQTPE
jgi:hypothetical protein